MDNDLWIKLAEYFIKAGQLPFPINDTVTEILKTVLTEDQAKFLLLLEKPSYNFEEIKPLTDLAEDSLNRMLNEIMHIGGLIGTRSRRTGTLVYRIPPFFPGLIEFTLMRGEIGPKQRRLALLLEDFLNGLIDDTQRNYDEMLKVMRSAPPVDRIVPVEEAIDVLEEALIPMDEISRIIKQSDPIGLAVCYCRHQKELLGQPCKKTSERKNCFSFGRTAEFVISQGFAQPVSKEEALRIFKECEDQGLVHKAFHDKLDPYREMDGICNCCKCCCGTFRMHYAGATPLMSRTSYMARIDDSKCIACGICAEECSATAIEMADSTAIINEQRCLGCGICVHLCPEKAIHLERTEPRTVFVPPPHLTASASG